MVEIINSLSRMAVKANGTDTLSSLLNIDNAYCTYHNAMLDEFADFPHHESPWSCPEVTAKTFPRFWLSATKALKTEGMITKSSSSTIPTERDTYRVNLSRYKCYWSNLE